MIRKLSSAQLTFDIVIALAWFLINGVAGGIRVSYFAVAFGMGAALAIRRLSPTLSLAVAWIASLAQVGFGISPLPANLAILAVLYATTAYGSRTLRWVAFASTFLGAGVITLTLVLPTLGGPVLPGETISGPDALAVARSSLVIFVGSSAAFLLSWTAGLLVRIWRQARENRRAVAVVATEEMVAEQERVRIARDMHDVVAHSLAVVVAQADGARYLGAKDPAATDAALATIATTAREALSDVRVLLAQLRHSQDDGPQPDARRSRPAVRAAARIGPRSSGSR